MITGGITIGPILETILHTKRTRETWFASYLFSWYMELFVKNLLNEGYVLQVPAIEENKESKTETGLYHDRIIFEHKSKEPDEAMSSLQAMNDKIIDHFVQLMMTAIDPNTELINKGENLKKEVIRQFRDWFQVKWFAMSGSLQFTDIKNILDQAEQSRIYHFTEVVKPCDRCKSLPAIICIRDERENRLNGAVHLCAVCALKNKAVDLIAVKEKVGRSDWYYPNTLLIAANEKYKDILSNAGLDKDDNIAVREYLDKDSPQKKYLHYYSILTMDGDNFSKVFESFKDNGSMTKAVSKRLFDFAKEISEVITRYGGKVIYAGGDDLLAILPTRNGDDHILKLIRDIQGKFNEHFIKEIATCPEIGISMGISVQHYKYPLKDALNAAYSLLNEAKACPNKKQANIVIRKHSGASFKLRLPMDDSDYLVSSAKLLSDSIKENFAPHSVYYKLDELCELIIHIPSASRLKQFFANQFNETIHASYEVAFKDIQALLRGIFNTSNDEKETETEATKEEVIKKKKEYVNTVSAILRLANLLRINGYSKTEEQA